MTGLKCSKGSGAVLETRKALGLTQKEFAEKTGLTISGISRVEREGRFFSYESDGVKAQLKFNKSVPREFRQKRHLYKPVGKKQVQSIRVKVGNCVYCGAVVEQYYQSYARGYKPCCNKSCATLYRYHGRKPLATPAPFGATVPAINPRIERARKSRKADLWRGMDKTLREAQEAKQ